MLEGWSLLNRVASLTAYNTSDMVKLMVTLRKILLVKEADSPYYTYATIFYDVCISRVVDLSLTALMD